MLAKVLWDRRKSLKTTKFILQNWEIEFSHGIVCPNLQAKGYLCLKYQKKNENENKKKTGQLRFYN